MKTLVTVAPGFDRLTRFVESLPERFTTSGTVIYSGRNEIRLIECDGLKMAVKRFGRKNVLASSVYLFKRGKAAASFYNALRLKSEGIFTPEPIAFVEVRNAVGLIVDSYYVSLYEPLVPLADAMGNEVDFDRKAIDGFARFVADLHRRGIIHRDLNNTNVVIIKDDSGDHRFGLIDVNRMKFDASPSRRERFDNTTRFSCDSPLYDYFSRRYLWFSGLDESHLADVKSAKTHHDSAVDRKKTLKRFFHKKS